MVTPPRVRRGCVYWVDFEPVRGSEQGKIRPALVIQNNLGNMTADTTIVVAISSRIPSKPYPMHVRLDGVLEKPSIVMCEQIRTVSLERVKPQPMAELPEETMAKVEDAVRHSLGLSPETVGL
jgi:mRNA interferase MazF